MEKQSSIELLVESFSKHFGKGWLTDETVVKEIEQAKQTHREEIEQAYRIAIHDSYNFDINKDDDEQIDFYSSKYYNETFKND